LIRTCLISTLLGFLAGPLFAAPPTFSLPLDCTLGDTCFIQQYVDADPGPEATDYTCGGLSYEGHKGTDFALPDVAAAIKGVAVLAAAPGRVTGIRDGETDHYLDPDDPGTPGRDCGNGVVIDHGQGWVSQYCHMQKGSISVQSGQRVTTGTPLGAVGMSGRAAFPHLHFAVRHDQVTTDPFAPTATSHCGLAETTLWRDPPPYSPGGLIGSGFSFDLPSFEQIRRGKAHAPKLGPEAPALVFWVHLFGSQPGDDLHLLIEGPSGVFLDQHVALNKAQARLFRASGRKLTSLQIPAGRYSGTATLTRNGQVIDRISNTTVLAR
jgi:hypothetical protein